VQSGSDSEPESLPLDHTAPVMKKNNQQQLAFPSFYFFLENGKKSELTRRTVEVRKLLVCRPGSVPPLPEP
jgi:hypothetical protein